MWCRASEAFGCVSAVLSIRDHGVRNSEDCAATKKELLNQALSQNGWGRKNWRSSQSKTFSSHQLDLKMLRCLLGRPSVTTKTECRKSRMRLNSAAFPPDLNVWLPR